MNYFKKILFPSQFKIPAHGKYCKAVSAAPADEAAKKKKKKIVIKNSFNVGSKAGQQLSKRESLVKLASQDVRGRVIRCERPGHKNSW